MSDLQQLKRRSDLLTIRVAPGLRLTFHGL